MAELAPPSLTHMMERCTTVERAGVQAMKGNCRPGSYLRWTDVPYAGETEPPSNPEEPLAGSWPTYYIYLDRKGNVRDRLGRVIDLGLRHPETIDWERELRVVQETLRNLTDEQKKIAIYWSTGVPTKQITPIIDRLIDTYGITAARAARIHVAVHAAINDTLVITWYYKFLWNVARPNQLDRNLATLVCTPRHPSYPAGHGSVAGCAEAVLSYFFPGESARLRQLAEECAVARLYAGVHFPADNDDGLRLGRAIGRAVVDALKRDTDCRRMPVDVPIHENRKADLPPPPYEQAIPFRFNRRCQSKVMLPDVMPMG